MRTLTAGELTALQAAHRKHYWRLEVEDAYGDYNDLTFAFESAEISSSVDRTVIQGQFRLRRATPGGSLSPYVTDALAAGRSIRLYHRVTVVGAAAPDPEDYRLVFDGEIDRVNAGGDPVELQCRDGIGAFVADRWTRRLTIAPLTFPTGTTLDAIVQAIITPVFPIDGATAPTLEIPSPTGVAIAAPLELDKAPMLENIRNTAQRIGWTVRPVWSDDESGFVLRLYEPPRDSEDVTWTYATNRYKAIPNLQQDREDIVNSVDVWFLNAATGVRLNVHADSEESAAKYGERWAEIIEADNSPISNSTLAQQLADSLISDLAEPLVEAEVTAPLHPYLDIDDRITLESYPLTHGTDQTLAIVGYRHRFGPNTAESIFQVRGKPTGGVRRWKQVDPPDITDAYSILSFDEVFRTPVGGTVRYRSTCGGLVTFVLAYHVTFQQATDVLADPYRYAEDNQIAMEALEPFVDSLQIVVDIDVNAPGRGEVTYIVLRPYHVTDDGQWVPGPAWHASLHPPPPLPPVIDTDDAENRVDAYLFATVQERGVPIDSVTFGYQVGDEGAPVEDVAATRGPGDTSQYDGHTLASNEYEFRVTKAIGQPTWLWARATDEDDVTSRSDPVAFGMHAQPWFTGRGPTVTGSVILLNGGNYKAAAVERLDGGGTWQVEGDGLTSVDVAQLDDSGNAGLGSATGLFRVTLLSDTLADSGITTLSEHADVSVNLTGSPATNEITLMTVSAPSVGNSAGSVTLRSSSGTPDITTERRYSIGGGPFTAWSTVAGASPSPAPTTATAYSLPGLPTARTLTGQRDPRQYPVVVQVRSTLHTGATVHDVQQREFSYTTNADDV